jgi:lambda repressor-like predicted transcriptional regulator
MRFVCLVGGHDLHKKCGAVLAMKGMTYRELCRRAGYTYSYLLDLLRGNRKSPAGRFAIAQGLGFKSWEEFEQAEVGVRVAEPQPEDAA